MAVGPGRFDMHGQHGWMIGAMLLASIVGGATSNLVLAARLGAQGADVVTASQVNIVDREGACGPCWPPRTSAD